MGGLVVVVDTIGLRCTLMDYCEHLWIFMDIYYHEHLQTNVPLYQLLPTDVDVP